ncbi:hypothetical protein EKO27_g8193 [Xylaria grammica]|uniref:Uncharacterized protein n=1 Tax=Xylaria grammica TaxID=363999 RepID=A0A439CXF8_9PEZI|nr:hypothetical protein EKO27_g8193 [Xylaria grammica]
MDSTPSTSFSSNSSNDSHPRRGSTKKGRDGGGTGKKDLHESDRNSFALPSPTSQETQPININPGTDTGSQSENEVEVEVESSSLYERAIDQAYEAIWNDFCGLPPSDNVLVFHLGCQRAYKKLHHKLAEKEELLNHYESLLQDGKDLRQKVQGVLIRFAGQVRTVLGVDIGYANPEKRKPDTYLHKSDESGEPLPGEILLPFDVLLPTEFRSEVPSPPPNIRISFKRLTEIIDAAVTFQRIDDGPGPVPVVEEADAIRFFNEDDELEEEHPLPAPKRQKTSSQAAALPLGQTRSMNKLISESHSRG